MKINEISKDEFKERLKDPLKANTEKAIMKLSTMLDGYDIKLSLYKPKTNAWYILLTSKSLDLTTVESSSRLSAWLKWRMDATKHFLSNMGDFLAKENI